MSLFRLSFSFALAFMATALRAQSTLPTLLKPLPAQTLVTAGTTITIDLRDYFGLPGVTGQVVQYDTVMGKFNVELLASAAPQHVANFLKYVAAGSYSNSFFHRSALNSSGVVSILQGGGYTWSGSQPVTMLKLSPVPLEYNLANTRGTLAAARTNDANSATSEWYFNVRDNSTLLAPGIDGSGYTVFGRVLGSGMTVVDGFAANPPMTRVNARALYGPAFEEVPARNFNPSATTLVTANMAIVHSISAVTIYPSTDSAASVLALTSQISAPSVVDATISGSNLSLTPKALGTVDVIIRAADTNGNVASSTFTITVSGPTSVSAAQGATVVFEAPGGATSYRWERNGSDLSGGTSATVSLADMQPSKIGLYAALMTTGTTTTASRSAILGVSTSEKVIGSAEEVGPNIVHPNGNIFDQLLLQGAAATFTADAGQVTRLSYIDLEDDIVQVEFSGAGSVSLLLDAATGPSAPVKYNQPTVAYMKGHAGIVVTGANETTNLSIFTVGRATAFDPTGAYDILQAPSATNVPANNGSSLFVGHGSTVYEGTAGVAFVAITSTNGQFGGIRAANATFYAVRGLTGIYAPDVSFTGPVFVGNIVAATEATGVLRLGSSTDVRIIGGNLEQLNARAVQVNGVTQLKFTAGITSHGIARPAQTNQARLEQDGVDVTSQIVVY
jgi:cyclophilin family peptidyl-prolyl cis-trans isomerase